jgi:nucleotide-binding universal stress UspA family protein
MLVPGNHRRGALAGTLVGSLDQRCAQRAHCSVVLVPLPPTPDTAPPW